MNYEFDFAIKQSSNFLAKYKKQPVCRKCYGHDWNEKIFELELDLDFLAIVHINNIS